MNKLEEDLKLLQEEIEKIKQRNKRVELDKAWETSLIRKLVIAVLTFLVVWIVLMVVQNPFALISGVLSALGYLISTLTYGLVKDWWLKKEDNR